ncbi:unnamed protein product [Pleuronectes platessa]|uniref:Uncharacterized protein n=1 Tax=Pleuronectes platessa TaxID=8262 RepID=A0A9N7UKZ6_PLEPL|nr:unnamed protein product [Pleuronectes platessa]
MQSGGFALLSPPSPPALLGASGPLHTFPMLRESHLQSVTSPRREKRHQSKGKATETQHSPWERFISCDRGGTVLPALKVTAQPPKTLRPHNHHLSHSHAANRLLYLKDHCLWGKEREVWERHVQRTLERLR